MFITICIDTDDGSERWIRTLSDTNSAFVEATNRTYAPPAINGLYVFTAPVARKVALTDFRTVIDKIRLDTSAITNTRRETLYLGEHSTPVIDFEGNVYMTFPEQTFGSISSENTLGNFTSNLAVSWNKTGY